MLRSEALSAPVENRLKWSFSKEEAFTSGLSSVPSSEWQLRACSHCLLSRSQLEQFSHTLLAARQCPWVMGWPQSLGRGPWLQFWEYRSWCVPSACPAPDVTLSTAAHALGHPHGAVAGFQQNCHRELLTALGDWGEHLEIDGCPRKDYFS